VTLRNRGLCLKSPGTKSSAGSNLLLSLAWNPAAVAQQGECILRPFLLHKTRTGVKNGPKTAICLSRSLGLWPLRELSGDGWVALGLESGRYAARRGEI
jgi:hypothetical protein